MCPGMRQTSCRGWRMTYKALYKAVKSCELPEILKLYFNDDHRWQFEGGCLNLPDYQVEQLKPWLSLRRLSASEVPIPDEQQQEFW